MIYAGIDIAKLNHFASIISSDGEMLVEPFQFSNDFEGFRSLSLVLDRYDRDQLLIGLESTDHYGNNLVEFLVAKGYRFCVPPYFPRFTLSITAACTGFVTGDVAFVLPDRVFTG